MHLSELFSTRREAILAAATDSLSRTHLAHYAAVGAAGRRARLERLFDLVVAAVADRQLAGIQRFAEEIAAERFLAGFDLAEVQTAFNVLEEAIWNAIVTTLPPGELAEALGLVSTALGAGKDRLAASFVSLASRTQAPALDFRALFAGTEAS